MDKTTAFVVLIGSEEKHGQTSPEVIGPFAGREEAQAFAASPIVEAWREQEGEVHGGWPTAHIISAETAERPEDWTEGHDFYLDGFEGTSA